MPQMNHSNRKNVSRAFAIDEHSVFSKISKLLETSNSSNQLVIAVYLLEQNRFLYCNAAFKKLFGAKMNCLLEGGWDFWLTNICPEEYLSIKNKLQTFFSVSVNHEPMTLRYHMLDVHDNMICMKHEIVLHKFNESTIALNYFFDISERERIEHGLNGQNGNNFSNNMKSGKPISPREEEVLRLIGNGYSSKQIANKLYISNHTAISHRKHLIEKFQVKNTAQLIKKASKIMEL